MFSGIQLICILVVMIDKNIYLYIVAVTGTKVPGINPKEVWVLKLLCCFKLFLVLIPPGGSPAACLAVVVDRY